MHQQTGKPVGVGSDLQKAPEHHDTSVTRRRKCVAVFIVLAVAALSWSFRWGGPIDLRYDAGVYYALGTSVAEGDGYRILSEPGAPEGMQYPPGLPALVAVHQWALGTSDPAIVGVWLKHTYALMFAAFALATLALATKYLGLRWGTLAAVLCLVQLNTYYLSNLLFSELPYALVSVCLALVLTSERLRDHRTTREIVGFLLVAIGFALRTAGLALLIAWIFEALLKKQWRIAIVRVVLASLPFAAWQVHVANVQQSAEYRQPAYAYQRAPYQFYNVSYAENLKLIDPFQPELGQATWRTMVARVKANLAVLPLAVGEAASESRGLWGGAVKTVFYPGRKSVLWIESAVCVPIALIAVLTLAGFIVLLRRRAWFPTVFMVGSVGLVCSTPWPQQFLRYLAPLGPFLSITLVVGLVAAVRGVRRFGRVGRIAMSSGLAMLLGGVLAVHAYAFANSAQSVFRVRPPQSVGANSTWAARRWFYYDRAWADWEKAVDWIGENAPENAIVATTSPHFCYLKTGRHAVFPPMEADPVKAERLLNDVPVTYVIVDELTFLDISRRYAVPALALAPGRWEVVQRFNKTAVFKRIPLHR